MLILVERGVNLHIVSKQCRLFTSTIRFAASCCIMRLTEFPENLKVLQAFLEYYFKLGSVCRGLCVDCVDSNTGSFRYLASHPNCLLTKYR